LERAQGKEAQPNQTTREGVGRGAGRSWGEIQLLCEKPGGEDTAELSLRGGKSKRVNVHKATMQKNTVEQTQAERTGQRSAKQSPRREGPKERGGRGERGISEDARRK